MTVKRNPGGVVSGAIHTLQRGDMLTVQGPQGRFVFDPEAHREPLVLAVAGSGVTPAMSILRTIHDRQIDLPVTLLYGARTRADIIFARELDALRLRLATFRLVIALSRPDPEWDGEVGRISPELLARHVADPASARYFLCGPGDLRETLTGWLEGRGVPVGVALKPRLAEHLHQVRQNYPGDDRGGDAPPEVQHRIRRETRHADGS